MTARRLSLGGLGALSLFFALLLLNGRTVAPLRAACGGDCVVPVNGWRYDNHQGGTYHYCFGSGFSDDQKNAIASGLEYWVTAMGSNAYAPELAVSEGGSCDLFITRQSYGSGSESVIAQGNGSSDGGNVTMVFNTAFDQDGYNLGNMSLGTYAWVAAHEFGHIIGFGHAEGDDCTREVSLMYFSVPPNLGSGPPSAVKCVDQDGTSSMYTPSGGGEDIQQQVHNEDWICDFHYTVTYWLQYYGGSWHVVNVTYELSYIDNCLPRME